MKAAPAAAQTGSNPQTYISGKGADSGTCVIAAPCLTLTYTLTQTQANGDVYIVDTWISPNENVIVTKGVGIHGGGNTASLGATTGTALTINAPTAITGVTLTDLEIWNPSGAATNGIVFNSGGPGTGLFLIHTNVDGFSGVGLTFSPNTSGGNIKLIISQNSRIQGNTGGILIRPVGSTNIRVEIKDGEITNSGNTFGFKIDTTAGAAAVYAEIVDFLILNAGSNGITVDAPTNPGEVLVSGTHLSQAGNFGVYSNGANASIILDNSRITYSSVAVSNNAGGIVASYGNNGINMNETNNTGILTPQGLH